MAAVGFDVDGVLLDSTSAHRRVWAAWARANDLDVEVVWKASFGRRPEDTVAEVGRGLNPASERPVLDQLLADHEDQVRAMPGAEELLAGLGRTPWAIVTSGSRTVTAARFRRLGLPLPRVQVFAEDVLRGKPDPECYLRAAELLAVSPVDLLIVEDAPAGIAAGHAAGCRVIAVATTHPVAALDQADEILDDLHEVAGRLRELI